MPPKKNTGNNAENNNNSSDNASRAHDHSASHVSSTLGALQREDGGQDLLRVLTWNLGGSVGGKEQGLGENVRLLEPHLIFLTEVAENYDGYNKEVKSFRDIDLDDAKYTLPRLQYECDASRNVRSADHQPGDYKFVRYGRVAVGWRNNSVDVTVLNYKHFEPSDVEALVFNVGKTVGSKKRSKMAVIYCPPRSKKDTERFAENVAKAWESLKADGVEFFFGDWNSWHETWFSWNHNLHVEQDANARGKKLVEVFAGAQYGFDPYSCTFLNEKGKLETKLNTHGTVVDFAVAVSGKSVSIVEESFFAFRVKRFVSQQELGDHKAVIGLVKCGVTPGHRSAKKKFSTRLPRPFHRSIFRWKLPKNKHTDTYQQKLLRNFLTFAAEKICPKSFHKQLQRRHKTPQVMIQWLISRIRSAASKAKLPCGIYNAEQKEKKSTTNRNNSSEKKNSNNSNNNSCEKNNSNNINSSNNTREQREYIDTLTMAHAIAGVSEHTLPRGLNRKRLESIASYLCTRSTNKGVQNPIAEQQWGEPLPAARCLEFDVEEIRAAILSLNRDVPADADGLPAEMLQFLAENPTTELDICELIQCVLNACCFHGVFPVQMSRSLALATQVFPSPEQKKDRQFKLDPANYCVQHYSQSVFTRIFDTLLWKRMAASVDLSKTVFGFCSPHHDNKSIALSLLQQQISDTSSLLNTVGGRQERSKILALRYDIERHWEDVSHDAVIKALEELGVCKELRDIVKTRLGSLRFYLKADGEFFLDDNGRLKEYVGKKKDHGLPRGTTLGNFCMIALQHSLQKAIHKSADVPPPETDGAPITLADFQKYLSELSTKLQKDPDFGKDPEFDFGPKLANLMALRNQHIALRTQTAALDADHPERYLLKDDCFLCLSDMTTGVITLTGWEPERMEKAAVVILDAIRKWTEDTTSGAELETCRMSAHWMVPLIERNDKKKWTRELGDSGVRADISIDTPLSFLGHEFAMSRDGHFTCTQSTVACLYRQPVDGAVNASTPLTARAGLVATFPWNALRGKGLFPLLAATNTDKNALFNKADKFTKIAMQSGTPEFARAVTPGQYPFHLEFLRQSCIVAQQLVYSPSTYPLSKAVSSMPKFPRGSEAAGAESLDDLGDIHREWCLKHVKSSLKVLQDFFLQYHKKKPVEGLPQDFAVAAAAQKIISELAKDLGSDNSIIGRLRISKPESLEKGALGYWTNVRIFVHRAPFRHFNKGAKSARVRFARMKMELQKQMNKEKKQKKTKKKKKQKMSSALGQDASSSPEEQKQKKEQEEQKKKKEDERMKKLKYILQEALRHLEAGRVVYTTDGSWKKDSETNEDDANGGGNNCSSYAVVQVWKPDPKKTLQDEPKGTKETTIGDNDEMTVRYCVVRVGDVGKEKCSSTAEACGLVAAARCAVQRAAQLPEERRRCGVAILTDANSLLSKLHKSEFFLGQYDTESRFVRRELVEAGKKVGDIHVSFIFGKVGFLPHDLAHNAATETRQALSASGTAKQPEFRDPALPIEKPLLNMLTYRDRKQIIKRVFEVCRKELRDEYWRKTFHLKKEDTVPPESTLRYLARKHRPWELHRLLQFLEGHSKNIANTEIGFPKWERKCHFCSTAVVKKAESADAPDVEHFFQCTGTRELRVKHLEGFETTEGTSTRKLKFDEVTMEHVRKNWTEWGKVIAMLTDARKELLDKWRTAADERSEKRDALPHPADASSKVSADAAAVAPQQSSSSAARGQRGTSSSSRRATRTSAKNAAQQQSSSAGNRRQRSASSSSRHTTRASSNAAPQQRSSSSAPRVVSRNIPPKPPNSACRQTSSSSAAPVASHSRKNQPAASQRHNRGVSASRPSSKQPKSRR